MNEEVNDEQSGYARTQRTRRYDYDTQKNYYQTLGRFPVPDFFPISRATKRPKSGPCSSAKLPVYVACCKFSPISIFHGAGGASLGATLMQCWSGKNALCLVWFSVCYGVFFASLVHFIHHLTPNFPKFIPVFTSFRLFQFQFGKVKLKIAFRNWFVSIVDLKAVWISSKTVSVSKKIGSFQ